MAARAILRRMLAGLLEEVEAEEFALDRERAMPESTEVTDDVLESRDRKCLCGSIAVWSVELSVACRWAGFGLVDGISVASGINSCLTSPLLIRSDTLSLDTRKPSSVKSGSGGEAWVMAGPCVPAGRA